MQSRTHGWKGTHWNVTRICTTAALLQKHKTAELGLKKVHPEQYFTRSKQWRRIAVREAALPWPPALTCARWVSFPGCSPSVPQFWMRFPSKNFPWPFCQCLHYLQVNPTLHGILIVLSPFPTSRVSPRQKNSSAIHWNKSSESPVAVAHPQPCSGSSRATVICTAAVTRVRARPPLRSLAKIPFPSSLQGLLYLLELFGTQATRSKR